MFNDPCIACYMGADPPVKATPVDASVSGVVGKTPVTLSCDVADGDRGNPATYTYTWSRSSLEPLPDGATQVDGQLTFTLNSADLEDVYSCTPGNGRGQGHPAHVTLTTIGEL